MDNELQLIQPLPALIAEQEMTVEQFKAAVSRAATQIQTGINAVWGLGIKAVKMAYGGSQYSHDYVEALLNGLPSDAARQTHDWLKKAGITVNRPVAGSKLYWLSFSTKKVGDDEVKFITSKKPGDEGYGLTMEKAIEFVKTRPPMAIERREAKPKGVKTLTGAAKNRAREAMVKTMKRLQKDDLEAARELNEIITTVDNTVNAFYDVNGLRQSLDAHEEVLVRKVLSSVAMKSIDAETILKVLSGEYKLILEEITQQG